MFSDILGDVLTANQATFLIMAVMFLASAFSIPLVKYFGRRTLLIWTNGSIVVFLVIMGYAANANYGAIMLIACLCFSAVF